MADLKKGLRIARAVAGWLVTVAVVLGMLGALALMVLPRMLGWSGIVVLSGSMEPALKVGGVAFAEPVAPRAVQVGDMLTFRHPDDARVLVTHRVTSRVARPGGIGFTTRGDANDVDDAWIVEESAVVGRVRVHVPYAGHIASLLRSRRAFTFMIAIPAAFVILGELRSIYANLRSRRPEDEQPAEVASQEPSPATP